MQTSPIHFVAATQNWIVKAAHYNVYFAHQSDTALIAVQVIFLEILIRFTITDKHNQ